MIRLLIDLWEAASFAWAYCRDWDRHWEEVERRVG